ncbi:molybdopterin-synthase adenylyltransferase MoeB [Roseateles sp. MS654]|uniref:molybdopterin-synthase adenylyltransferase MoeB n=1 Tax=Roseateles sp. MS654 TaxID=3412685 RepID=UPI003C30B613
MMLSNAEIERYSRHLKLPQVGTAGQARLKQASVLVVGCGGLGSPVAMYLAAAGVGLIALLDEDVVDLSNLHRQIVHFSDDVGLPKVQSAAAKLRAINPEIQVVPLQAALIVENADKYIGAYDFIVDCTDNFSTRYLINDVAVAHRKPVVFGSVFRFEGQVSVFGFNSGPCYRCLFPTRPSEAQSCVEGGVLGVLPGMVGTMQANEVLKLILNAGSPLSGTVLSFNALEMRFDRLEVEQDPQCRTCGNDPLAFDSAEYDNYCSATAFSDKQVAPETVQKWKEYGYGLLDVRTTDEFNSGHIAGAVNSPLDELKAGRLPSRAKWIVYCKSGVRSANAYKILSENGFDDALTLAGGLLAWRDKIDSKVFVQ